MRAPTVFRRSPRCFRRAREPVFSARARAHGGFAASLVPRPGLEPRIGEPKSPVLPVTPPGIGAAIVRRARKDLNVALVGIDAPTDRVPAPSPTMRVHPSLPILAVLAWAGCGSPPPPVVEPPGEPISYSFEKFDVGTVPDSFVLGGSVGSSSARWSILEIAGAPSGRRVLAQQDASADAAQRCVAWLRNARFGDFTLRARVQATGNGIVDCGLVWHLRDGSTYLAMRLSSVDRTVALESVESGVVKSLGFRPFAAVPGRWYGLAVEQSGNRVRCGIDGLVLLDLVDPAPQVGSVGMTTIGACTAEFDDFAVVGGR